MAATPRLTVKAVNDELQTVKQHVDALEDLFKRSSVRDAHPELGRKIGQMHRDLEALKARLDNAHDDQITLSAIQAELGRLETRGDDFHRELNTRIEALEGWRRDIVDPALEDISTHIGRLTHESEQNAAASASAHARLDQVSTYLTSRFNLLVAGIAALVCFLGLWAWVASDWATPVVAKGRIIGWAYGVQNENWAFMIVLGCAIVIVVGLGWATAHLGNPLSRSTSASASATAASATTAQPAPQAPTSTTAIVPASPPVQV